MTNRKLLRKIASVTVAFSTTLWLSGAAMVMPAAAQTVQDLLAQIATLQAQLLALQGQPAAGVGMLTKTLRLGMTDPEVSTLQGGLKQDAAVYPQGLVTGYFGPLTRAAVIKFQEKYASEILTPLGLARGTGLVGAATRAKFNALYGGPAVSPTPGVTPGVSPSPAPAGGLSVALAPDYPAGATLVADLVNADGAQALADVLKVRFTAGAGGAVKVTTVKLHRTGISTDSDFSNVYLYDGSKRLADSPSVSGGYFTFTNSNGIFEVSGGGAKDITVKVDLANGVSAGKTFKFGIAASSDVVSSATSIALTAFYGNEFRTAQVNDLGKLTLTNQSPAANNTVDAGLTNHEVWRFTAKADDQKVAVSYLKVSLIGTADFDALQNLKLYVDGVQVGATVTLMNSDKTAAFDLAAAPVEIGSGVTKTLSLRGDVLKGSGRNFYFQITGSSDIVAKDMGYGVFIKVQGTDVWSIFKAGGTTSINEGSLTVTKSTGSPSGPLALNATNLEVARYDVKAVGEDIKISKISVNVNDDDTIGSGFTNLKNLKATVAGSQVGTTVSTALTDAANDFSAGNSFVVKAGTTVNLSFWADMQSSGTEDVLAANDAFTVLLSIAGADVTRLSSGTSFTTAPATNLAANAITVTSGGLAATKNASLANVTSVLGATGVTIGSWLITAPSDQGVNINSITIEDNAEAGLGSAFDVFQLFSGTTQYGQTVNTPSSATGTDLVFSFSSALNIPAGQSKQIDLKANVLSSADTAVWDGDATDAARVIAMNATGVVTNSAVSYTSGNVVGQLLTISAGAILTLDREVSPTMPDSQYLVAGDLGQTLAAWKFTANNTEDVKVTRVAVYEIGSDDLFGNVQNLKLYVDGVQVGAAVPAFAQGGLATTDTALFEDLAGLFTVSKNSSKTLVLRADMTPNTNATFDANGADMRVRIKVADGTATSLTNVSAKGVTSGTFVIISNACTSDECDSSNMKVVKSKPTFALVSPGSTVLQAGFTEVLRFRITAHAAEDVKFVSGTHNIRLTQTSSGAATAYAYELFDGATNTSICTVSGSFANAGTPDFTTDCNITVSKGTSKELYVKTNLTNFGTQSGKDSFQVSIKNAALDLSWSDSTSGADYSNASFVGIGLPLEGAIFVEP